jgi:NitT/TauT family transport system permease protein
MLNIPRTFACIFLLCGFGLSIWWAASWVQWLLLHRWHESELKEEGA